MPNHCENDLYITGPAGEVNALLVCVGADKETPDFNFNAVIPYPERFTKIDEEMEALGMEKFREKYGAKASDGFNSGGYEWCVENWGTKWTAYKVSTRKADEGDTIVISFQTAWAPPTPVILALHKKFPAVSLHLEYFEMGAAYCGGFSCVSEENHCGGLIPWTPGRLVDEWKGEYRGHRGG